MKLPSNGARVQIKSVIAAPEECAAFFVKPEYIQNRRAGESGVYAGYVPGAGGDLWWIKHEDGTAGAYIFTEVEVETRSEACESVTEQS